MQGAVTVVDSKTKLDRTWPCHAGECKHKGEVKRVTLELEKQREKTARLECGISKGEMLYFEVI